MEGFDSEGKMIISDQQREENFQEYLRLLHDSDYYDVTFDDKSGGVSAIHREHVFDKKEGPFGCKRGDYEKHVSTVLRKASHSIILVSEKPVGKGIKRHDASLDGLHAEIKTVEGVGRWSVRTKIVLALKQGASILVLYYPMKNLFLPSRVEEALLICNTTLCVIIIVEDRIVETIKPPW